MTVRWSPVTLMKARGFPFYAVSYTSNDAVRIRQAEQIIVYDAAFVSITELSPLADYSVSVTVLNHGNKSGMSTSETDRMTSLAVISQSMSYTLIFYGQCTHRDVPLPHYYLPSLRFRSSCSHFMHSPGCSFSSVLLLCMLVSLSIRFCPLSNVFSLLCTSYSKLLLVLQIKTQTL